LRLALLGFSKELRQADLARISTRDNMVGPTRIYIPPRHLSSALPVPLSEGADAESGVQLRVRAGELDGGSDRLARGRDTRGGAGGLNTRGKRWAPLQGSVAREHERVDERLEGEGVVGAGVGGLGPDGEGAAPVGGLTWLA
jgi:hypothetical protein